MSAFVIMFYLRSEQGQEPTMPLDGFSTPLWARLIRSKTTMFRSNKGSLRVLFKTVQKRQIAGAVDGVL
jgi:hypothetical protein